MQVTGEIVDVFGTVASIRLEHDDVTLLSETGELSPISRKAKRRVTMEEIRKLLGEDVEIVDPLPTQQEEKAIYEKMYHVCSTGCSIPCPNKV